MTENHDLHSPPSAELDLLGGQIEDLLESIGTQYDALRLSIQESRDVDEYALQRLTARLTVQRDDLWRIDEQLRRWLSEESTAEQRLEVQRLGEQMVRLYDMIDAILQLAGELERRSVAKPLQNHRAGAKAVTPRKRRSANRPHDAEQP